MPKYRIHFDEHAIRDLGNEMIAWWIALSAVALVAWLLSLLLRWLLGFVP